MYTRLKDTLLMAVLLIPTTALMACALVMPVTIMMSLLAISAMDYRIVLDVVSIAMPVAITSVTLLVSITVATAVSHS